MWRPKQFPRLTMLCLLAVFFLVYVVLHNVSSSRTRCIACEDGGSGVENVTPTQWRDLYRPSSYKRSVDVDSSASSHWRGVGRRTFASPYLHHYTETPLCNNYTPVEYPDDPSAPDSKLILYWQHHDVIPVTNRFSSLCHRPLSRPCQITFDQRRYATADAVVFHASRLHDPHPPFRKRRGQIWIARGLESPIHWNSGYRSPGWRRVFNWTMTYRPDSEFFMPVGNLVQIPEGPGKDFRKIAASKTRSVAWFVSDCHTVSRREEYVKQLMKYIDVDVFGLCGTLDCPKHGQECDDMLTEKYRFYLSFENSFCPHYVTEKFFKQYGDLQSSVDIIPVVRGGTDYRKYFPEGTFIDAADFKSPKDLATYLHSFGADIDAYAAVLERKSVFRTCHRLKKEPWCKLCDMLHDNNLPSNLYDDLAAWWDRESCVDKKDVTDF